jgi:ABC-type nitrate/sulfonate/bicarbonate transport system substrate-binding protein
MLGTVLARIQSALGHVSKRDQCGGLPRRRRSRKLAPISVVVFPGGFNWPIWVAQANGYFERNGITVKLTPTPNSGFQLTNLIDGKFDIAMTAIDNVVAYDEKQSEAPTIADPDLIAFMGAIMASCASSLYPK